MKTTILTFEVKVWIRYDTKKDRKYAVQLATDIASGQQGFRSVDAGSVQAEYQRTKLIAKTALKAAGETK